MCLLQCCSCRTPILPCCWHLLRSWQSDNPKRQTERSLAELHSLRHPKEYSLFSHTLGQCCSLWPSQWALQSTLCGRPVLVRTFTGILQDDQYYYHHSTATFSFISCPRQGRRGTENGERISQDFSANYRQEWLLFYSLASFPLFHCHPLLPARRHSSAPLLFPLNCRHFKGRHTPRILLLLLLVN